MKKKKILQISKEIDHTTQEIKRESKIYSVEREPDFVKLYVQDLCNINNLKKNAYQVLLQALYYLDYEGHITLMAYHRQKIAKAIGLTDQTVKNQLTLLCQKKILKRKSNMIYAVNPDLFAKGDWANINKMRDEFKLTIEYKSNRRIMKGKSVPRKVNLKAVD